MSYYYGSNWPEPIYSVCIKPVLDDEEGYWSGSVDMYLEESDTEEVNPEVNDAMRTCVGMMASAFALMEENDEFLQAVGEKYNELYAEYAPLSDQDIAEGSLQKLDKEFDESNSRPEVSFNGNVISLKFDKGKE